MKFLLIILSINLSFASEVKTYDAKGLNIRQRLDLIKRINEENQQKNNKSPKAKAEEFFQKLKEKGSEAVSDIKAGSMVEDSSTVFVDQEMQKTEDRSSGFKKINNALSQKDGEVKSYKKIGDDETLLNGSYYKTRYLIEYKNGRTQSVEMLYIKPTVTGEYILTEFLVN